MKKAIEAFDNLNNEVTPENRKEFKKDTLKLRSQENKSPGTQVVRIEKRLYEPIEQYARDNKITYPGRVINMLIEKGMNDYLKLKAKK